MMKTINWLFIIAGTLVMMYVMMSTGKTLKTPFTPLGILDLEFAYNSSKVNAILNTWSPAAPGEIDNIRVAIRNTWLDFIFLFFYSLFLFYSCKTIAESFNGILQKIGKLLAMGALNAGLLDIVENAGMLISMNGFASDGIAMPTTISAVIKWILALAALAYVVLFGPLFLLKKISRR